MAGEDRDRWNRRYADADPMQGEPSDFVRSLEGILPEGGRALDVAGGAGADAVWLAEHGLATTVADVSDRALELAAERARRRDVPLDTVRIDLETDLFPEGPWDLILCRYYLQRDLFPAAVRSLAPGGLLCVCIATVRNLERHENPSARFLLEEGELPSLVPTLQIVRSTEGWTGDGPGDRHEARLVARRPVGAGG